MSPGTAYAVRVAAVMGQSGKIPLPPLLAGFSTGMGQNGKIPTTTHADGVHGGYGSERETITFEQVVLMMEGLSM